MCNVIGTKESLLMLALSLYSLLKAEAQRTISFHVNQNPPIISILEEFRNTYIGDSVLM